MSSRTRAPAQRGGQHLWAEVKKIEDENAQLRKEIGGRERSTVAELNLKIARYQKRLEDVKKANQALKKAQKKTPITADAQTQTTAPPTTDAQTQTDPDANQTACQSQPQTRTTAPTTSDAQIQTTAPTATDAQTQTTAPTATDAQTQTTAPATTDAQTQTVPDPSEVASRVQHTVDQNRIQELQYILQQLQFENAALTDAQASGVALASANAELLRHLHQQVTDLHADVSTATTEKEDEIKQLQKELDDLQKKKSDNDQEHDRNTRKLAENTKQIRDLQGQLASATTQSAQSGHHAAELQQLQAKLAALTQERDAAVQERDAADSRGTRSSKRLADQNEQLKGSLAKKQKKLDDAKAAAALPSDKEKKCEEEKKRLKAELKKLEQKVKDLTEQMKDAVAAAANPSDAEKKCEEEKKRLKAELKKSEQKVKEVTKKLKDAVDAAANPSDAEHKCEEEKKLLQEELGRLRKKIADLKKKLKDATDAAGDPSGAEKRCQEEKKLLQGELEKSRKQIADLKKRLDDAAWEKAEAIRLLKLDQQEGGHRPQRRPEGAVDRADRADGADGGKQSLNKPTLNEPLPTAVANQFNQLIATTRSFVEEILGTHSAAIVNNLKTDPSTGFTFRDFLHQNPDLVDRNYAVDEAILVSSVLIRYLHNFVFVSAQQMYPDLAFFVGNIKTIRDAMEKDGRDDQFIKIWNGYWYQCLFQNPQFDATRDKVIDLTTEEISHLLEFVVDPVGRDAFLARVKKEIVTPALKFNEQLESSASYWYVGLQSPQEVWKELSGADGPALLDALGRRQFTNTSDDLRNFNYETMAKRLNLPAVPDKNYVCPNFRVLSNIYPNLTVRAPALDGTTYGAPNVLVGQRLLISWVPPGATPAARHTTDMAKLLLERNGVQEG